MASKQEKGFYEKEDKIIWNKDRQGSYEVS